MKVPPYGKPLKELLQAGHIPTNDIYIYFGAGAWHKGRLVSQKQPDRTLILPPTEIPERYDWPVSGCDILLIETSPMTAEFIEDFVYILFNYGAKQIIVIRHDLTYFFYKKDF